MNMSILPMTSPSAQPQKITWVQVKNIPLGRIGTVTGHTIWKNRCLNTALIIHSTTKSVIWHPQNPAILQQQVVNIPMQLKYKKTNILNMTEALKEELKNSLKETEKKDKEKFGRNQ